MSAPETVCAPPSAGCRPGRYRQAPMHRLLPPQSCGPPWAERRCDRHQSVTRRGGCTLRGGMPRGGPTQVGRLRSTVTLADVARVPHANGSTRPSGRKCARRWAACRQSNWYGTDPTPRGCGRSADGYRSYNAGSPRPCTRASCRGCEMTAASDMWYRETSVQSPWSARSLTMQSPIGRAHSTVIGKSASETKESVFMIYP